MYSQLYNYIAASGLLPPEEVRSITALFRPVTLVKGRYFAKEQHICRHVAFLIRGGVRGFTTDTEGRENTICFNFENTVLTAYESLINGTPASKSIQAMEDCQLLQISYEDIKRLMGSSTSLIRWVQHITEQELIAKEHYMMHFNNRTAKEKYLRLLTYRPEYVQRVNAEYLASYLGLTRRTLTRVKREISRSPK